jgi:hypothetical protein
VTEERCSAATERKGIMTEPKPAKRFTCRVCGLILPAWLPVAQDPDGALLLAHLGQRHPDRVKAYLDRIHDETDITPVAAEANEVIGDRQPEDEERRKR